jgi:hypothetical protein
MNILWNVGTCAAQECQVGVEYFYMIIHYANIFKNRETQNA